MNQSSAEIANRVNALSCKRKYWRFSQIWLTWQATVRGTFLAIRAIREKLKSYTEKSAILRFSQELRLQSLNWLMLTSGGFSTVQIFRNRSSNDVDDWSRTTKASEEQEIFFFARIQVTRRHIFEAWNFATKFAMNTGLHCSNSLSKFTES